MRHENKFVFDKTDYSKIVNAIMSSKFLFSEIYSKRTINNIYLDTFTYENYYANTMGEQNRVKQRIRWYGNTKEAIRPVLEYKNKVGELGYKEYYDMPDFILNDTFTYDKYLFEINNLAKAKDDLKFTEMYSEIVHLIPTLYNTYQRLYFLSADGKYRITIDDTMQFYRIGNNYSSSEGIAIDDLVVELKYGDDDKEKASEIVQELGFRISRNSKYVNGVYGLYF